MEKMSADSNFNQRVRLRRARAYKPKDLTMDLLLLLPPVLLTMVLGSLAPYSLFLSLFLLYFILPMYYTVEERVRARLTGIGNPDFNYADGYHAFFLDNKGGIFGALSIFFIALGIAVIFALALSPLLPSLVACFDGASDAFHTFGTLYMDPKTTAEEMNQFLLDSGYLLSQPMSVYIGLIFFVPMALSLFFLFDNNLVDHHIASMVLPDLDRNVSASMARSLSRRSFGRFSSGFRFKEDIRRNWIYYALFTLFYGVSLYVCSLIRVDNFNLVVPVVLITPVASVFYGVYLNYFALLNKFTIAEESKNVLLEGMPLALRSSIQQTFDNPSYIHGEESEKRGPFIPEEEPKQEENFTATVKEKPGEGVKGVVLDLSHSQSRKEKKE